MKKLLLFGLLLMSSASYAAPHPAVGSSALSSLEKGLFWHRAGFSLQASEKEWMAAESSTQETEVILKARSSGTQKLAIKLDELKQDLSIENYAKKWMKDYSNYGFEVLGSQPFQLGEQRGLVIDLEHKRNFQQVRQVLFLRSKKAVLFTCMDDRKKFSSSLQLCNRVIQSFLWLPEKKSQKIN